MYQVIARKYRPQTFSDVVSQDHVRQTLQNALSQNRIGHGYILSGQRGTGKTTMARILAKALNCEQGPTADPCLQCASCQEITAGNALDVIEIDAASNRRIDDIRELREKVRYRPARDRYKVFIIDEAHQITSDAFNALLKTLEEPPEWVVFVLCTTEPEDIPATIASRCQSFQFQAVELDQTVGRMEWICEQEGIEADTDALVSMALAGDGSIRDALSTLDQAIACFGNKLEAGPVRDLLGAISTEITDDILQALRDRRPSAMLEVVDRVTKEGRHLQHFCGELARYFRNLLVMKVSGADTRLVTIGPNERSRMTARLEDFSVEDLTRYLQILLALYRDLQHAPQPRFRLEVGLLKLVHASHLQPIEKVLSEWNAEGSGESKPREQSSSPTGQRLASKRPSAKVSPRRTASAPSAPPPEPPKQKAAALAASAGPSAGSTTEDRRASPIAATGAQTTAGDTELRAKLTALLQNRGDHHLADAVEHGLIERAANQIEVRALADYRTALQIDLEHLRDALEKILGGELRVTLGPDLLETDLAQDVLAAPSPSGKLADSSPAVPRADVSESDAPEDNGVSDRAMADPEVQKYRKLFQGQVREVRDLRGYSS